MKLYSFLIILFTIITSYAQNDTLPCIKSEVFVSDRMPHWVEGNNSDLIKLIHQNLNYPSDECVQGIVILEFTVDTFGNVVNPKIHRSISGYIDKQLLSAIVGYKFRPSTYMNKRVSSVLSFPFKIYLKP